MIDQLKAKFESDPLTTIAVGALAVTAAAKLLDAVGGMASRRAYARQTNRRARYPMS